tara:strand:- start:5319 stop:5726 length:408 start_codon:yes stop_codon:yes gene_type:complete
MKIKYIKFTKGILAQEAVNSSGFPKVKDKVVKKSKKKKKGPTTKKNDINGTTRNGKKVKSSKARLGKANGRWKGGTSKSYRRAVANAKRGEVVHHKDHNKKNNKRSNYAKLTPGEHNKAHPEKGGHNKKKRRKKK